VAAWKDPGTHTREGWKCKGGESEDNWRNMDSPPSKTLPFGVARCG